VKRSLLVEGNGVPLGVAIDGANRHDKKLVEATIDSIPVERPDPTPERPQGLCLDKGRLRQHAQAGGGVRLRGARAGAGRGGTGDQAGGRFPGTALGRGADA
jgi:hypothetical protein